MRLTPPLAVGALALLMVGCTPHSPNGFERGYVDIARETGNPALCYKIAPQVRENFDIWPRIFYTRSKCFYHVATGTRKPNLCEHVRAVRTIFNGDTYTRQSCEETATQKYNPRTSYRRMYGDTEADEVFFLLLGYDAVEAADQKIKWHRDERFFAKAPESFPDFSQGDKEALRQLFELAPDCRDQEANSRLCNLVDCFLIREYHEVYNCVQSLGPAT